MEPNLPRDESNSASPQNSSRQWERRDQSQREGPSQVRGLFGEGAFAEESRRIIEAFREVDAARSSLVKEELTYGQFLQAVIADPRHMIRNTFQYTADAMESFGFELKNILGKEVRDFPRPTVALGIGDGRGEKEARGAGVGVGPVLPTDAAFWSSRVRQSNVYL